MGAHEMMKSAVVRCRLAVVLAGTLAVFVAALTTGCGDEQGNFAGVEVPTLRVSPDVITFPPIGVGETNSYVVTIENVGGGELIVASYQWSGTSNDYSVEGLDNVRLSPDQESVFNITYAPSDALADVAELTIVSNGGDATIQVTTVEQAPYLRTNPTAVDLIADGIGSQAEQQVEIFNAGTETLSLSGISLNTSSSDFASVVDFELPTELGIGTVVTMTIQYTPSGRGADEATLVLNHDGINSEDGATRVPVIGSLRTPYIVVDPEYVAFGPVPIDETRQESVTIYNEGEAPLNIQDVYLDFESSDDISIALFNDIVFVDGEVTPVSLEEGQSVEMVVEYAPSDNTPDSGTVIIASNDPDFPFYELDMGGTLDAPYLSVVPEVLGFGSIANGLDRSMGVIIRNAGSQPLLLDTPVLSGHEAYSFDNLDLMPTELAPDESFELMINFAPPVTSLLQGEVMISASNDPWRSPVTVFLNGAGAGEPFCELALTPETVNFGMVPRGSSRTMVSRVDNIGPGYCLIRNVRVQPPMFGGLMDLFSDDFSLESVSIPAGTTMNPGDSFLVEATYAPTTITAFGETPLGDTGSIEIDAIDPGADIADTSDDEVVQCGYSAFFNFTGFARECGINLQGRSGIADLAVIPATVDFGLVTRGCASQNIDVKIYNIGSANVTITAIGLGSCTDEFYLSGVPTELVPPPGEFIIAPGAEPLTVNVAFAPDDLGVSACELVIESDAETAPRLVVPLTGEGTDFTDQTDHFEQISGREVDFLFVVDNSGSMVEEQTNLATNFDRLIDEAVAWDTDYQIGIITTEIDEEYRGRQPGELVGDPRILIPSTPSLEAEFSENVNVGDGGTGAREAGLGAAYLALTDPLISDISDCTDCLEPYACVANADGSESRCGGYNRSFLREDASLEIVFVSDEEDQSRGTIEFYIDFFASIKGAANSSLFHASAIVGPRGGCTDSGGAADAGDRYIDVADATGGVTASICDTDFSATLATIGERAFGLRVQWFLSRIADPATVVVTDSDGSTMGGWSYDESTNSVVFTDATAPLPGEAFDVSYTALCFPLP